MIRVKLTKRLIDSIIPPESGQVFMRDRSLIGFAVRVTHGSKSFILERRIHGRARRITLGAYPPMTIEDARGRAETLIGEIARGGDPAQELLDRKRELTFADLEQMYRTRHLPKKRSRYNDEWMLDTYLAGWRTRKLSGISRKDVIGLHEQVGQNHSRYTANRLISLLRKMYNLARSWGIFTQENPAIQIEFFHEEKRERFLHPEELRRLFESLKQEPNIFIRTIILMLLLTGARKSEVLRAKWENLNLAEGVWYIPVTKSGRPHTIPLPTPLIEVLRNLPITADNPFLFPGRGNGHFTNLQHLWNQLRTRADLPDLRLHDLRRSTGSWLAGAGASLPLIGRVLGHSQPAVTQIYARFDMTPIRQALEANAQRMLQAATSMPPDTEESKNRDAMQQ